MSIQRSTFQLRDQRSDHSFQRPGADQPDGSVESGMKSSSQAGEQMVVEPRE